ncbi:MAG: amidohydrolase family protein [Christensenellales bacterium]
MRTAIENAVVLTMDDDMRLDKGLRADGRKNIAEVGEGAFAGEADERIDARGGILLPGFVNTHCHVSMVPFRTMGDDCPDRLRRFLFPLENEAMTRELVYRGAVFGIGEMLLAGVTTFADMYYFEDEVRAPCVRTGMRGYLGETLISQPTCDSASPAAGLRLLRRCLTRGAEAAGAPDCRAARHDDLRRSAPARGRGAGRRA